MSTSFLEFKNRSSTARQPTRNFFSSGISSTGGANGELNLREEIDELFFGYSSGIRHGYPIIIRNIRRDSNNRKIPCTCKDPISREPDFNCSYCFGEGFLADENWTWTYSTYVGSDGGLTNRIKYMPPGATKVDFKVFYFRYDTNIKYGDKIVEVKLDEDGNVVLPLIKESIYGLETINKLRSDNSRIEFITVYCKENDAIRLEDL